MAMRRVFGSSGKANRAIKKRFGGNGEKIVEHNLCEGQLNPIRIEAARADNASRFMALKKRPTIG